MTPSADIYSLGKVIFYMLSEGVILPREHIHEEQYRQFFAKGERYGLMELLLRRMICPQNQRIQSAGEVIKDLEKIEAWEKNARLLPIGDVALASIEQISAVIARSWPCRRREPASAQSGNAGVGDSATKPDGLADCRIEKVRAAHFVGQHQVRSPRRRHTRWSATGADSPQLDVSRFERRRADV